MSAQGTLDFSGSRMRVSEQKPLGGHQHAGRAEPALDSSVIDERLLQGVEFASLGESFNSRDVRTVSLQSQGEARADRVSIHQHGARSAHPFPTTFLGAGEVKIVPQ
jgi:hypothetical protein